MTAVVRAVITAVMTAVVPGLYGRGAGLPHPEPGEMLLWMQGNYMSCQLAIFCTYWSYHPIHSKPAGRAPKRAVNQARIGPLRRLNAPRPSISAVRLPYPSRSEPNRLCMTLGELKRCKMHENERSGL